MKYTQTVFLFLTLIIFFLSSCAVKSKYNSSKNASYGGAFERNKGANPQPTSAPIVPEEIAVSAQSAPEWSSSLSTKAYKHFLAATTVKKGLHSHRELLRHAPGDTTSPEPKKQPILKEAKIGFWLTIGGALTPVFTSFIGAFAESLELETLQILLAGLSTLSLLALIGGLVLGIIALRKMKKEPNKYRGYGMALTAVILPSVYLVLALLYVLVVLLLLIVILGL